jgi:hypothetical protein
MLWRVGREPRRAFGVTISRLFARRPGCDRLDHGQLRRPASWLRLTILDGTGRSCSLAQRSGAGARANRQPRTTFRCEHARILPSSALRPTDSRQSPVVSACGLSSAVRDSLSRSMTARVSVHWQRPYISRRKRQTRWRQRNGRASCWGVVTPLRNVAATYRVGRHPPGSPHQR